MTETSLPSASSEGTSAERHCAYHILRYTPSLVRDEWVNIGVLLFDPKTGERRLRTIEEQDEYRRVRRLHPQADEALLRAIRDDLEDRFQSASPNGGNGNTADWQKLLAKWEDTLSNALQLAPQKGVLATDLDVELERLYSDHVAPPRPHSRVGAPGTRAQIRSYCSQVFRQAGLWSRIEKSLRVAEFTFPGDPMRIDYSYRRNGTRGFVQTLSVTRAPNDAKALAYTTAHIIAKSSLKTEFTCVTDVELKKDNERHSFVRKTLGEEGITHIAMDHFAVWANQLKPMMQ